MMARLLRDGFRLFGCVLSLTSALEGSGAGLFTVELPQPSVPTVVSNLLVAHGELWHWRRGTNAPQVDWQTAADANLDGSWSIAAGGFGYGDNAIVGEATRVNPGMSNIHSTVYIRRAFHLPPAFEPGARLILTADFDDGLVAYIDGQERARTNVPGQAGSFVSHTATTGGFSHEASCCNGPNPPSVIDLGAATNWVPGEHVLALIGVNQTIDSSDFHLIADLALVTPPEPTNDAPLVNRGLYALATSPTVTLQGSNTMAGSVRVTVNGDDALFDRAAGTWSRAQTLSPGYTRCCLAAHGSGGEIITNFWLDVVYQAATLEVGGVLSGANTWNDPSVVIRVTNDVVVPSGALLEVGAGVVVIVAPAKSITATTNGTVRVSGRDGSRAVFLPATGAWGWLRALGANAAVDLRHGEVVAAQVRVYDGGTLLIEDSVIRDLPNLSLEVIQAVRGAQLTLRRSYMTRFAEGDSQETPVLVEGCLLEGFLVDGMDIKATAVPLVVRRSTFRRADPGNSNADAIDFGPGAGTVEGCLIHDFPDKGVSIGGAPGTTVRDSLIYRCGIGLSAYSSPGLVFQNITVADCTTGVLFRDNPTRAEGLATNLIVWGNVTNVSILGTSLLGMAFSDVEGTNYPGEGNLSLDPLFTNPAGENYQLSPGSPARHSGLAGSDMGARFPVGGIPSQPAALVANATSGSQIQLSWDDTAENEAGLLVERSTNGVDWMAVGAVGPDVQSFSDQSVLAGTNYYYRVRATNDVGVSEFSNRARATTIPSPSLHIEKLDETKIVLSFEAVAGQSYTLQSRSNLAADDWAEETQIPPRPITETVRLTNTISGTERYFRLITPY